MAHLISQASGKSEAFFALKPAWHGLGTVLDHAPDSATAIEAAGLNWTVDQLPLVARKTIQTPEGEVVRDIDAPEHVANVRSDTGHVLGVVGDGYKVIQNVEAFQFLDGLLQDGVLKYESAGALKDGRIVWMLGRLPSVDTIAQGDDVLRYVLLTMAHDGTGAIRGLPTATRVVCWNTLSAALRKGKDSIVTIRHSGDIASKMRQAQYMLAQYDKQFTDHADACRHLAGKRYNASELETFLNTLFPPVANEGRAKTIRDNDIASVRVNLESPRQRVGGIAGSWWSALNAVTELVDHQSTTRGATQRDKDENRMMASIGLHGRAAQFKETALELALTMAV